jgi:hypothetical protein
VISGTASANLIKKPPDTGGPTKTHVMSAQT